MLKQNSQLCLNLEFNIRPCIQLIPEIVMSELNWLDGVNSCQLNGRIDVV